MTLRTSETNGDVLVFLEGEKDPLVPLVMTYIEKVSFKEPSL